MNRVSTGLKSRNRRPATWLRSLYRWLPDHVDARVRLIGWLSLAGQLLLVASGGAVRLTGSGLGCPTWPKCTADSLTTTPEMGIHGIIEFGNRMLTFVLTIIVILAFLFVMRMRAKRPDLFWLTFWLGMSIPVQAVVGGFTVLFRLNPYMVGVHFVLSIVLTIVTTVLVCRIHTTPSARVLAVPPWFAWAAWIMAAFAMITVLVGILTTGSGPHAGDADTLRTGFDTEFMEHIHALPAYITAGFTLLLVGASIGLAVGPVRRFLALLVVVEVLQIGVGLLQANTGLPGILVGTHMVLSALLMSAVTAVLVNLTQPVEAPEGATSRTSGAVASTSA
ncbi:COX15/CtaA family protein [Microbacterium sp. STN6]|uniref:COX15/CtaA family protein n=1 Tax=Microbacterium sp. STN6 TaxID=2995588 RepID=UPI0022609AB2|nr:COX15/CtaA family protein [Microbacterium sp. STN6]MCX7521620.1 COX15/CtaA family protein [Microbacterium sp. STN6]